MGDLSSGDIALILWAVYFVVLLFRMVVWCGKGAAEEIREDVLATIDTAVKRGTERGVELAKQDAKKRREQS